MRKPKKSVRELNSFERLTHGLSFRILVMIVFLTIFIALMILFVGVGMYFQTMLDEYRSVTCTYAKSINMMLDDDKMLAKTEQVIDIYDSLPEEVRENPKGEGYKKNFVPVLDNDFRQLQADMRAMQNEIGLSNAFIVALDQEKDRMIYLIDADPRPASFCFPGTWDEYEPSEIDILIHGTTPSKIQKALGMDSNVQATITNLPQFGLRVTGGETLYKTDKYAVILCLDEKLDHLVTMTKLFLRRFLYLTLIAIVIGCAVSMHMIRKRVGRPIGKMATAARKYVKDKMEGVAAPDHFNKLDISTQDEIEELSLAMKDMENGLIEYEQNLQKITAERERIQTELDLATRIQRDMLPMVFPPFPERTEFDLYATMDPAKEVGGDFYDFFLIDDDHLGFIIADVSGKGIPAALFMMVSKTILNDLAMGGMSPSQVLQTANDSICTRNKEEMFVTVWFGILEISTGIIKCANAGHEKPMVIKADGEVVLINEKPNFVIGGMEGMKYKEYEIALNPGDKIFLYTDGVAEATDSDNNLFGIDRTIDALKENTSADSEEVLRNVRAAVDRFVGEAEQFDDLTMLCLEYKGK
ncbi:MAG: serine/threonine-protein phosphatase [Lachnospiraceae bacterium]|nr:serine/threonine-protein phosphatase [Lachnospiraceae bacterium]